MTDNSNENIFSESSENRQYSPSEYDKNLNMQDNPFLYSENDDDIALSSENIDFDDTHTQQEESVRIEDSEYTPPEYTYPFSQEEPSADAQVNQPEESQMESCEWYGNSPIYTPDYDTVNQRVKSEKQKKEKKKLPVAVIVLICVVVSVLFGSGSAIITGYLFSKDTSVAYISNKEDNSPQNKNESNIPLSVELSTTDIVDKYAVSVVEIITESVETGGFSQQYIKSGAGSGVIIDSEGYIVTNHHVIEGARKITVTLRDGQNYAATLVGYDEKMDLALLKVEAEGLIAAVLGDSDTLKVGQRTIAIGNPLGQLGGTVTEGIISALDRNISSENTAETLIQTDAAINPGNSGGALINSQGQIIGITSSKIADTDVEGLGFAIPIDFAKPIIEDIIQYGYVKDRPATGISGEAVSAAMSRYYGLPKGVIVTVVDINSGADLAGIEEYDIITEIDGKAITSMSDIQAINETHSVGDVIQVTFYRDRQYQTVNLKLLEDRGR